MGMREKLIELMKDTHANAVWHKWGYEESADHLIANGVIVSKMETVATDTNVGDKWISVKDRLPEDWKERVLVKIKDANNIIGHPAMDTDRYMGEIWVRWGHNVTHWMPLPKPPKEENDES